MAAKHHSKSPKIDRAHKIRARKRKVISEGEKTKEAKLI